MAMSFFDSSETAMLTSGERQALNSLTELVLATSPEYRRLVDAAKDAAVNSFSAGRSFGQQYSIACKLFDAENARSLEAVLTKPLPVL